MSTLNNAFMNEVNRVVEERSTIEQPEGDELLTAMTNLLILLLKRIHNEELPSDVDLYARPKPLHTRMTPSPS
jgi:hypothetical protein